jgi:ABC-type Mn2+/Zn2+ transport system permease subunit
MSTTVEVGALALSVSMAVASGLVGCFAVMRRMALAADAMSHIALPGIGLALILRLNPLLGALAMLLLGAVLIWALQRRSRISTEAVIGVTFSIALAVGSTITSGEQLIEALLGTSGEISGWETAAGIAASLGVVALVLRLRSALVVSLVSPEVALTSGVEVGRIDLYFMLAFALTIALGLRYLGVLLMGSLIIIPAAIARRFASSLDGMFLIAVVSAVVSTACGTYAAALAGRQSGPFIVMIAGALFFVSLVRRSRA